MFSCLVIFLILLSLNVTACGNGCGPKFLNINSIESHFKNCCNKHDLCYG